MGRFTHSRGNRRPDDWQGDHFQVSGLGHQVSGSGAQVQVRVQEICHPSSDIDPVIQFGWRVAAPGGWWQGFSIQPSTQSSIQASAIDSVICPLSSIQPSIQQLYVVTRSRPYPRQTRAARGAAPTSRHSLPLYSILHTRYSLHSPAAVSSRWSWNRAWKLSA